MHSVREKRLCCNSPQVAIPEVKTAGHSGVSLAMKNYTLAKNIILIFRKFWV
jgi:hypothetical protein